MKLLFVDVETTGLNPDRHGVIQLAALHEGSQFVARVNPGKAVLYDKEALKVNGIKKKKIKKFPKSSVVMDNFVQWMKKEINPYDKNDKFIAVGYNVKFDVEFLHGWARREGFMYMGSYIDWRVIDVLVLARTAHYLGQLPGKPEDFKLVTICELYGINGATHDALEDIEATRELFYKITRRWE